jgi:hypothetical protein
VARAPRTEGINVDLKLQETMIDKYLLMWLLSVPAILLIVGYVLLR